MRDSVGYKWKLQEFFPFLIHRHKQQMNDLKRNVDDSSKRTLMEIS